MKKLLILLIVAIGCSNLAYAQEIGAGTYSGQKTLAELLTTRFSNLQNMSCIQDSVNKAKLRSALVAIGMRLSSITLQPDLDPLTGGVTLSVELNYTGEPEVRQVTEYAGSCLLRTRFQ